MKPLILILVIGLLTHVAMAQNQNTVNLAKVKPHETYDNVLVKPLFFDSLSSSYIIWVKYEVQLHKHVKHTEYVLVLKGKGIIKIGNKSYKAKKGDLFHIPFNTAHSWVTTSKQAAKVLSTQSPQFMGKDRVFLGSEKLKQ